MTDYILQKSKRKTLVLKIGEDLKPIVKAPYQMSKKEIDTFITSHEKWIEKQTQALSEKKEREQKLFGSSEQIKKIKNLSETVIKEKLDYYSNLTGFEYKGFKITSAKHRFGSCSTDNRLCFSYRLMSYPDEAIDYVVLHELAHTKQKNHSKKFYELIENYMPDYKERVKMLK